MVLQSTEGSTSSRRDEAVAAFLQQHRRPLRVWIGPVLWDTHATRLRPLLGEDAELLAVPPEESSADNLPEGPAVLLLAADDLHGPHREALLELAHRALPGQPIVHGGSRNRDTLLKAINEWRTFRLLPTHVTAEAVADAIRKAHEALSVRDALNRCADELRLECTQLERAIGELRATQERLLHRERLAAIGQMSGEVMNKCHEHSRSIERLGQALEPLADRSTVNEVLAHVVEGTQSIHALLSDLLALSENRGEEDVVLRSEAIDEMVERTVALVRLDPATRRHQIVVDCQSGATVFVDRHRLYHVLMNLLRNAVQATQPAELIAVRTARHDDGVTIDVEDHGTGIPEAVLGRLFSPFVSTKGAEGTGLGLRMSKSAIERQGGALECSSTPGQGTCFRIRLPTSS